MLFLDLLVLFGAGLVLHDRIEKTQFHIDEAAWIGYGYYYDLVFKQGEIDGPEWESYPARCDFPVGKYLFGLGLSLQGMPILDRKIYDNFNRYWNEPLLLYHSLSVDVLFGGRNVAWFFSTLAVFFVYLFVGKASGKIGGIVAGGLLLLNPATVVFTQALSDSMLIAGLAGGGLLLATWSARDDALKPRNLIAPGILGGVIIGLTTGVKANGAILGVFFATLAVAKFIEHKSSQDRAKIALVSLMAALTAFAVFYLINPALYDNPIQSIAETLEIRANTVAEQQANIGPAIDGAASKVFMVALRTLFVGPYIPFKLMGLISITGMLLLTLAPGVYRTGAEVPLALWCACLYVLTTAWIPLDWDRYYLPAGVAAACAAGAAVGVGTRRLYRIAKDRWFPEPVEEAIDPFA